MNDALMGDDSDILLSPEQAAEMLAISKRIDRIGSDVTHIRHKRKALSRKTPIWNLPIFYKFDHSHSKFGKAMDS